MGGTGIAIDDREAASALRWWLEMGVDTPVQDQPRNWLEKAPEAAPAEPEALAEPLAPDTLAEFRDWLASSSGPLSSQSRPVLPIGAAEADVMVLADPPTSEELSSGQPVGGEAGELLQRMLAAIGMAQSAYLANLSCFHSPVRPSNDELQRCADAALRHIALARPKRLLLLGNLVCRLLVGKPLAEARGQVHSIEGVRTVATFHPRTLVEQAKHKKSAWEDLLLLTGNQP